MENYELGVKVSIVTIIINIILAIGKIVAGIIGQSSAMLADGIHTLSDVVSTFIVIIGLKVSSKDSDKNHPYGHEKYEPIFAKILSIFLIITGFFIGYEGLKILIIGEIKTPRQIALVAALMSIIVKEGMFWYTIKTAKKIKSFTMEADAWHHRSDVLSSVGTFIGILGARLGFKILDPIAAIVVSILIIKVGIDMYLQSIRGLVDESADDQTIEDIKNIALSVQGVESIKNLKTRIFGNRIYVDINILVDGELSVTKGHEIAEKVHNIIEYNIHDVKHCMIQIGPESDISK